MASRRALTDHRQAADGTLTPIRTFPAGLEPVGISVDPAALFLYATNIEISPGSISEFAIDSDGTLTLINTFSTAGALPASVAITPGGRFAYAGSGGWYPPRNH
jgi:6-phosphogluconolactonase (cycloisomerase 2 family)